MGRIILQTSVSGFAPRPARGRWAAAVAAALLAGGFTGSARSQEDRKAAQPAARDEPEADFEKIADLNARYRFVERYSTALNPTEPGVVGQYRVSLRETIQEAVDRPKGAAEKSEAKLEMLFTERPAEVSSVGSVTAALRQYETVRFSRTPSDPGSAARPMDNLLIWFQPRAGMNALILSLSPSRKLGVFDYLTSTRTTFLPDLVEILPTGPRRLGDTWRIPKAAVESLFPRGDRTAGDILTGRLDEIRREKASGQYVALISVTGRISNARAETSVNARVQFSFVPPPPPPPVDAAGPKSKAKDPLADDGTVDARGAITELRMALSVTDLGRSRRTDRRELIVRRQVRSTGLALTLPTRPPESTPENSWITYADPRGRFQFREPQDFGTNPSDNGEGADLIRRRPAQGPDVVYLRKLADPKDKSKGQAPPDSKAPAPAAKAEPPPAVAAEARDGDAAKPDRDPEAIRKRRYDEWQRKGLDALHGPYGYLPPDGWPAGVRVYRIEAVLKQPGGARARGTTTRVHYDGYVIQLPGDVVYSVEAMTAQDPPLEFRNEIETVLKTFRVGVAEDN